MDIRDPEYIIIDYQNITNEKINNSFNCFHLVIQSEFVNYPDRLFNLCNLIIRLYNERSFTNDVFHYIEVSKTLWNKLQTFQSEHKLHIDILDDQRRESILRSFYTENVIKNKDNKNDTVNSLKNKKEILLFFYSNAIDHYTAVLNRLESHRDNKQFHFRSYINQTRNKLNSFIIEKDTAIRNINSNIEEIREKNHRRAVLEQCFKQNFGFSSLKPIENSLIYNIDSYL